MVVTVGNLGLVANAEKFVTFFLFRIQKEFEKTVESDFLSKLELMEHEDLLEGFF